MIKYPLQIPVILALAGSLLFACSGCSKDKSAPVSTDPTYYNRIRFVVQNNVDYKQFTQAMANAGLLDTLAAPGPFTLLLAKQDPGEVPAYQIWPGAVSLGKLPVAINQEIPTLNGATAYVSKYVLNEGVDTVTTVNGMYVTKADIAASNGLINTMDQSPVAEQYETLNDLLQTRTETRLLAVIFQRANLNALLQSKEPYTLLAPTTTAFTSDAAFTWLQLKTVDDVYAADSAKLALFAKNLIIPGRLFVNDFFVNWMKGEQTYTTLGGQTITVNAAANGLQYASVGFSGQGNSTPVTLSSSTASGNFPVKNGVMLLLPKVLSPN